MQGNAQSGLTRQLDQCSSIEFTQERLIRTFVQQCTAHLALCGESSSEKLQTALKQSVEYFQQLQETQTLEYEHEVYNRVSGELIACESELVDTLGEQMYSMTTSKLRETIHKSVTRVSGVLWKTLMTGEIQSKTSQWLGKLRQLEVENKSFEEIKRTLTLKLKKAQTQKDEFKAKSSVLQEKLRELQGQLSTTKSGLSIDEPSFKQPSTQPLATPKKLKLHKYARVQPLKFTESAKESDLLRFKLRELEEENTALKAKSLTRQLEWDKLQLQRAVAVLQSKLKILVTAARKFLRAVPARSGRLEDHKFRFEAKLKTVCDDNWVKSKRSRSTIDDLIETARDPLVLERDELLQKVQKLEAAPSQHVEALVAAAAQEAESTCSALHSKLAVLEARLERLLQHFQTGLKVSLDTLTDLNTMVDYNPNPLYEDWVNQRIQELTEDIEVLLDEKERSDKELQGLHSQNLQLQQALYRQNSIKPKLRLEEPEEFPVAAALKESELHCVQQENTRLLELNEQLQAQVQTLQQSCQHTEKAMATALQLADQEIEELRWSLLEQSRTSSGVC